MKTLLLLTFLSSITLAQSNDFGFGSGNFGSGLPYGDRPNFICKTATNAARMYIGANVYTYFHSKTVKVDLFHVSTYRSEQVASETSTPTFMKPLEIRLDRPQKNNNQNNQNEDGVFFPSFNSEPKLTYHLVKQSGSNWFGKFSVRVNQTMNNDGQLRTYNMNCKKM